MFKSDSSGFQNTVSDQNNDSSGFRCLYQYGKLTLVCGRLIKQTQVTNRNSE